MYALSYFKNDTIISKSFRNKDKLDKFINKKRLTTYILNGWWHIIVKEGHK